jgi:hypothetical protein
MRVSDIPAILDLAWQARQNGHVFSPKFEGEAGLGKSQGIQQWVKKMQEKHGEFGFIDLRLAFMESPDLIGFPYEYEDENGRKRMGHSLPYFWPTEGKGLLLLEEPNRANTAVTNCIMQLMTDRKVGPNYQLPDGWIIAAATNPETSNYDVNSFDSALNDRFETFKIDYDFVSFMSYVENSSWHDRLVQYLKSGQWVYKTPDAIGKEGQYISPRTWSKINAAEKSGAAENVSMHLTVCQSILGKHEGLQYWQTCWQDRPILAEDLISNFKSSIKKLKEQSRTGENYAGDKVDMTVKSVIDNYDGWYEGRVDMKNKDWPKEEGKIDEATMIEVAKVIPSDQAINLIQGCAQKIARRMKSTQFFKELTKRHPDMLEILKQNIKVRKEVIND